MSPPRDARAEAEALRRLVGRAEMGEAVQWLERRLQLGHDVFARGASAEGNAEATRHGDVTGLLRACLAAVVVPAEAVALTLSSPSVWTVADAIGRIRRLLPKLGEAGASLWSFLPEIPRELPNRTPGCRETVAATFVAGRELARDGAIAFRRDKPDPFVILVGDSDRAG